MKVKATNEFKRLGKKPVELRRIPEPGEVFDMTEKRFYILNGHNRYGVKFVIDAREPLPKEVVKVEEVFEEVNVPAEDDIIFEDLIIEEEPQVVEEIIIEPEVEEAPKKCRKHKTSEE